MDVNAIVRQGSTGPAASPVARTPSSAASGSSGPRAPTTDSLDIPGLTQAESAQVAVQTADIRSSQSAPNGLRLRIEESTNRVIAEIVNENNEVIKQLPPEEALRAAARFREAVGLIFDQQI